MSTLSSANVKDVNLVLKERTHMRLCLNMLIFMHNLGNWLSSITQITTFKHCHNDNNNDDNDNDLSICSSSCTFSFTDQQSSIIHVPEQTCWIVTSHVKLLLSVRPYNRFTHNWLMAIYHVGQKKLHHFIFAIALSELHLLRHFWHTYTSIIFLSSVYSIFFI